MITELKTYNIKCDFCHETLIIYDVKSTPSLPASWSRVTSGGWGSHGYGTRTHDRCQKCTLEDKNYG